MKDLKYIALNYFQTIRVDTQWFLLYEFEIKSDDLFNRSDEEIIKDLFKTRVLNSTIYHPEMDSQRIQLSRVALKSLQRPFDFEKLTVNDFEVIHDKIGFKKWLIKFRTEGWEDDREDAINLIHQAEEEIFQRTNFKNGVRLLSKNKFNDKDNKLADINWIYLHFETFVEIDREHNMIRTFDFGYD